MSHDGQGADATGIDIPIPACPAVLLDLRSEIAKDAPDHNRIARLVGSDAALGVGVLRAVNSPLYGLTRKVESIGQAVTIIGLQRLGTLLTAVLLRQALAVKGIDLEAFWQVSARRAFAMKSLATRLRCAEPEAAYTTGLVCDIGIPLLLRRYPDYADCLQLAKDMDVGIPALARQFPNYADLLTAGAEDASRAFTEIEFARYGIDHATLGARMARTWGLSATLCDALRHHHDHAVFGDGSLPDTVRALVAIGFVAEFAIQRSRGIADTAEWTRAGESALAVLGWSAQEMSDWQDDIAEALAGAAP